ncbi:hypothetical protein jhhlp_000527 [Lomentospora prolificans]|uniref:Major facilitator superfamily (MFS) profile domain-containing protein n=1 Tax=Lomentospora prolificans TaxID=41688 RepID=A0A2N3NLC9_9PEZI|nr:hypothetical protein jhhlp_000527 [Lomentospora prolificans]
MASETRRPRLIRAAQSCADELGLTSFYHTPPDVKILCLLRLTRMFGYGALTLVLATFLRELQVSRTAIGFFMTLTLAGDVMISFVLALFADSIGRRAVLCFGSSLMIVSGVTFALSENYWVLLIGAILGILSPNGGETGPFRAIEESTVAHLTNTRRRSDIYAWYNVSGTIGSAFGMIICGWVTQYLHAVLGWPLVESYRVMFYGYASIGALKILLVSRLSRAVEWDTEGREVTSPLLSSNGTETTPLLRENVSRTSANSSSTGPGNGLALPSISRESIKVMSVLCLLFALDAFATGLSPLTWVTFFFRTRYGLDEGTLGSLFFTTRTMAAVSMILASSLAKRLGNVKTMVFTHLPSAVFLALIPIPDDVHLSVVFLVLRSCLQSMSIAPRSAFIAAMVLPEERTAVMGMVNVVRTTSQSLGPLVTGFLADHDLFWTSFVCAGSLRASYDIGLLVLFKNREHDRSKGETEEDGNEEPRP